MDKPPQNQIGGLLEDLVNYPEHLKLIGMIVTRWSALEGRLALTLWELLGSPDNASTIYYTLGSSRVQRDVVRSVAMQVLHGAELEEAKRLIEAFNRLGKQRNRIVHGQWGTPSAGSENPFVSIAQPAKNPGHWSHIYTLRELQGLADAIRQVDIEIDRFNLYLMAREDRRVASRLAALRAENTSLDTYLRKFE